MLLVASLALSTARPTLPRCTVAVAGANGRVGSMVCRELLRNHPQVTVRALVRSASDPYQGYGRLSYEVGAEDGQMDIAPAWRIGEDGVMGAQSVEFDEAVQGTYGLDRLEIRECELRYRRDVEAALSDVDACIYCASAFNSFRQRLPDRLDDAAGSIAKFGTNLFELRFGKALFGEPPKEDGSDEARREAARGKTADVEGLSNALAVLESTRSRRARLAELTGGQAASRIADVPPLVLLSAAASLGYDEQTGIGGEELRENEFGFRKRTAEAAVRESGLPHVIVRSSAIDDVRGEEGLTVTAISEADRTSNAAVQAGVAAGAEGADGAIGVRADPEVKRRRIHPRDLAAYLVDSLSGAAATDSVLLADQIARLDAEKASAVEKQDFLRAGELLEEVKRLKERQAASTTEVDDSAALAAVSATVEVYTYLEGKPLFR